MAPKQSNQLVSKSSQDLCEKLIETTESAEALGWLESPNSTLGVMTNADSVRFAQTAYQMGAQSLTAVEIESYPDESQNTGRVCIGLPNAPEDRRRVFSWAESVVAPQGFDVEDDVGQNLMFLMLD